MVASKLAKGSGTAENLAMGDQARGLKESFMNAYADAAAHDIGYEGEGTGGKEIDRQMMAQISEFDRAKTYYFGSVRNVLLDVNKEAASSPFVRLPVAIVLENCY